MRIAAAVTLSPEQTEVLERMARARSLPARVVERARVVLMAADGLENQEIAARMNLTPEKAARWRNRFLAGGVAALQKDAPRPGKPRTITERKVKRVVEMSCTISRRTPPLVDAQHGAGGGHQRGQCAPHLACAWTEAASGAEL